MDLFGVEVEDLEELGAKPETSGQNLTPDMGGPWVRTPDLEKKLRWRWTLQKSARPGIKSCLKIEI